MSTTTLKAADTDELQSDLARMLLQQAEATLSIAWDVCDHTRTLDTALHDIRCAIDRVRSAADAIQTAADTDAITRAAAAGRPVSAADADEQRTADADDPPCETHYQDNQGRCHRCGLLMDPGLWQQYIGTAADAGDN